MRTPFPGHAAIPVVVERVLFLVLLAHWVFTTRNTRQRTEERTAQPPLVVRAVQEAGPAVLVAAQGLLVQRERAAMATRPVMAARLVTMSMGIHTSLGP